MSTPFLVYMIALVLLSVPVIRSGFTTKLEQEQEYHQTNNYCAAGFA